MIYLTGDIHRKIDDRFTKPIAKKLGKNDYLIVLGDFGGVWYDDNSDNLFLSYFECFFTGNFAVSLLANIFVFYCLSVFYLVLQP